jgi:TctA family transporter
MEYLISLIAGTLYGFVFGIIPVAGAATGLITIYGFLDIFRHDPYTLVVFTTALVVASTIGDSFSSVMMNIPGASGSAATMVDGFPMAKRGEGARALSAALFTSTANGIFWGILVFAFLPFYSSVVLHFAIPEMLAFLVLAFSCVVFVNSHYWIRGILALAFGVFLGLVGQDPVTGSARFTGGWYYLQNGIQILPVLAGFLAVPELLEAFVLKAEVVKVRVEDVWKQIKQGANDSLMHWKDGARGGVIGGFIGMLPGIGGNICDWLAYGQTVALNKNEKIPFGEGNVKGVIGCEGANNSQKATAYLPTVLFGIPAAPFEAIIMSLFIMVGLELGSPQLLSDQTFFYSLASSYMWSMILTFILSIVFIRYASLITNIPFKFYFWILLALITWSCVQYTGYWEDFAILAACIAMGVLAKNFKFSRAAIIIGFVLSDRIESTFRQYSTLYQWQDIFTRPISGMLLVLSMVALVYGAYFNRSKISYV